MVQRSRSAPTPHLAWGKASPGRSVRRRSRKSGWSRLPTCRGFRSRQRGVSSTHSNPVPRWSPPRTKACVAIPWDFRGVTTVSSRRCQATRARKRLSARTNGSCSSSRRTTPASRATSTRRPIWRAEIPWFVVSAEAGTQRRWSLTRETSKTLDPRFRGDDASVFQSLRRFASCSWTDASLGAVLPPHVALATDNAILLALHFPPRPQLRLFKRTRDQEALRLLATVALEIFELSDGLDAFGDDAKPKAVRQGDDRLRDRFVVLVLLQAVDKTLVDLDGLDRQTREVGQARIAGSEIVDGDRHAHLLQLHERRHRLFGMGDDHALRDFQIEIARRQAAGMQGVFDNRKPAVVLQLLHRQVHRKTQHPVMGVPGHDLPTPVTQYSRPQRLDHSRFLGDGNELVRSDHTPLRIAPP